MEGNQINQLKSVLSEGDTADYIAQLLKGSGASINYDQLRDELGKVDGASSFAHTVSTINSISVDPTSISVHHPPSHTAQSANLEDFDEFLKSNQNNENNLAELSQISQKAFFSSSANSQKPMKSSIIGTSKLSTTNDNFVASTAESRTPLREDNRPMHMSDLEKNVYSSQVNSPPSLQNSSIQLEKLSKRLEENGFGSLHASLKGQLSETQRLHLISTLSLLVSEFENRGNTIQNLVNELSHGKENFAPDNSSEVISPQQQLIDLQQKMHELKQALDQKTYLTEKLQFEAKAKLLREEATRNRNYSMLETIKQKYFYDNPGVEPILANIIQTYEDKLARPQPVPLNHVNDITEYPTGDSNIKNLESEIKLLKGELLATQEERDVLNLKLINQLNSGAAVVEDDEEKDLRGLTTRQRIARDKRIWKEKHGSDSNKQTFSFVDSHDPKSMLKEICGRLGITDFDNILPCIEKIQLVVSLIPQMEQFIREVNATVRAYNINIHKENSSASNSISPQSPLKLSESLLVIRQWADNMAASKDQLEFVTELHEKLGVKYSSGSFELCLVELSRMMKEGRTVGGVLIPESDVSQQAVSHLMGLFNINAIDQVIPKMNELYVFWAEVNDGLIRLREALYIEKSVQPGRVLIHASEVLEKQASPVPT